MIETLEALLTKGQDNALLRFGLGNAYFKEGKLEQAIEHLRVAVCRDAQYSAAWKMLGKALAEAGQVDEAIAAYKNGIGSAEYKGDKQAAKEMQVFLKRLQKTAESKKQAD
jgi:predicted Zn-dependent protease